ncbi:MAG: hypothetical protein WC712_03535, partial [Candidatus Brocadiia bacterium]
YYRPNLLTNPSFDSPLDPANARGWIKLAPEGDKSIRIAQEAGNRFAVVNTANLQKPDRNPYLENVLDQVVLFTAAGKQVSLTGRVYKETEAGMALVSVKAHGVNERSKFGSYRYDGPPGKWVDFAVTAFAPVALEQQEVVLGFFGEGAARFDDLDLVYGEPRGGELTALAFHYAAIFIALAVALMALELLMKFTARKS